MVAGECGDFIMEEIEWSGRDNEEWQALGRRGQPPLEMALENASVSSLV